MFAQVQQLEGDLLCVAMLIRDANGRKQLVYSENKGNSIAMEAPSIPKMMTMEAPPVQTPVVSAPIKTVSPVVPATDKEALLASLKAECKAKGIKLGRGEWFSVDKMKARLGMAPAAPIQKPVVSAPVQTQAAPVQSAAPSATKKSGGFKSKNDNGPEFYALTGKERLIVVKTKAGNEKEVLEIETGLTMSPKNETFPNAPAVKVMDVDKDRSAFLKDGVLTGNVWKVPVINVLREVK